MKKSDRIISNGSKITISPQSARGQASFNSEITKLRGQIGALKSRLDTHIKSPFYMDLGIEEFKNCELLLILSHESITPKCALLDFLRNHQTYKFEARNMIDGFGIEDDNSVDHIRWLGNKMEKPSCD